MCVMVERLSESSDNGWIWHVCEVPDPVLLVFQFPSLCNQYYKLITFICEIFPEKIPQLPEDLFKSLMFSLELGMTSYPLCGAILYFFFLFIYFIFPSLFHLYFFFFSVFYSQVTKTSSELKVCNWVPLPHNTLHTHASEKQDIIKTFKKNWVQGSVGGTSLSHRHQTRRTSEFLFL